MVIIVAQIHIFDADTWEGMQYTVYIISNSRVSNFNFNAEEKALIQFNIDSVTGTTGFCRATIPKDLLSVEDNWFVLVDSNSVTPSVNEDAGNSYL